MKVGYSLADFEVVEIGGYIYDINALARTEK
jgi:hypothetical protein